MPKRHHSKLRCELRHLTDWRQLCLFAIIAIAACNPSSHAADCVVNSSKHRVALLELYTSQGCNSCPPADRWLNGLQDRGTGVTQVVPLAFHVDYWDYIGWKDHFARPEFSQRQRLVAARNQASFIYTPQFVLDGRDLRRPWLADTLAERLRDINAKHADVSITLAQTRQDNIVRVSVRARNTDAQNAHLFVALFQNRLHSDIKAGENAGKQLYHEFVVRELEGPLPLAPGASLEHEVQFDLGAYGNASAFGFAVFAENGDSGAIMQAMAEPLCNTLSGSTSANAAGASPQK